jgi:hypothetical protein
MTIYVHMNNRTVGYGEHFHVAPTIDAEHLERTWNFSCDEPGCEERILKDVEHSARNAASVPLSAEEKAEEEAIGQTAKKDVNTMAMALSQWAKSEAAKSTPVNA